MAEDNNTPQFPGAEAQGSQPTNETTSQNADQGAGPAGDGLANQSPTGVGGGAANGAGQSGQRSSQRADASAGTASAGQGGSPQDQGAEDGASSRPAGADLSDFSSEAQEGTAPAQSGVEKEREREAILDVPVKITAVVGDVKMPVRDLVRLGRGAVVPLNRKLGSSIDIYANDRLIARGEITIIEDDNIAVTMTEIMSSSSST